MECVETKPYGLWRLLFFALVVRPFTIVALGLNVRGGERLPFRGPAIIVANHNSHLDTLALMTLFPLSVLRLVRPVAAADYFLKNKYVAWLALRLIGIIPIARAEIGHKHDPLEGCYRALERGEILIVFPEGSRGEPERLGKFKTGVAHLAEKFAHAPVIPVFMHGMGKALPRGEAIFVPFFCDICVGEPFTWPGDRKAFMDHMEETMKELASGIQPPEWE